MTKRDRPRIAPTLAPPSATDPVDVLLAPEPPAPPAPPAKRRRFRPLRWLFVLFLVAMLAPPAIVLPLRWYPPPTTAFMLRSEVQPVKYEWVDASRIPETLRLAAIGAEDQKFWDHFGFDLVAIAEALEHNEKSKRKRGASTITQQVAKNLFMWPSRSYLRKGLEATFTLLIELCWPKERILEVYLNIAEFGPGVYGAQAAAREFFRKDAEDLTPLESARLVAVLPNPRKWSARHPGPYVQTRVDWILAHIGHGPPSEAELVPELDLEPPLEPAGDLTTAPMTESGVEPATGLPPEPPAQGEAPVEAPADQATPPPETEAPADAAAPTAETAEPPPAP